MWLSKKKLIEMPARQSALPGRTERVFSLSGRHVVLGTSLEGPYPNHSEQALFGMGCFWGAERLFWQQDGVFTTAVGYSGGFTPNPTYQEVCTGLTGHNEVVLVVFDPGAIGFDKLLKLFFESHDPTQGMRQGNDIGTQYRSAIYTTTESQLSLSRAAADTYARLLSAKGYGRLTTEIAPASDFYFAEEEHQQYLANNPWGYCGLAGTGVACPASEAVAAS
jgi:peptide-methionine (S)-S-oxide reductase